ncbi:hypothetical protein [Priestia aryabhattai]|uniref:hypothetical protein n=1 Tax=Priestia aryabhattai TaxID=412384 RepID=UPI0032E8B3F4
MLDVKGSFISYLVSAKDIVNAMNSEKEDEKGYITYLTTAGWVTGKEYDISTVDVNSEEGIARALKELKEQGKGLDALSIALSMYNKTAKDFKDEKGIEINEPNRAIFLEDVSIKSPSSKMVNANVFVLFSDQIIGVLPGKMDLQLLND